MWYITAVIITVVIVFLIRSYKKRVKRMYTQMDILCSVATLVVLDRITEKTIPNGLYSDLNELSALKLAAVCNYLLGRKLQPIQLERFSTEEIVMNALAYLDSDQKLRELVIQSLRAQHLIHFHKTNDLLKDSVEILAKYGRQFPIAPNPESYLELMKKLISELNSKNQALIMQFIETKWPNFYRRHFVT